MAPRSSYPRVPATVLLAVFSLCAAACGGSSSGTPSCGPCDTNASCNETLVPPACVCHAGYTGTGRACTPVTCPALTVTNGSVTPAGIGTYQGSVAYGCDANYALSAGDATRTCQADGTWSGTAPSCVATPTACDANPCVHGPCTPASSGYTCGPCDAGWTGTNCDQLVICSGLVDPDHGSVTPKATTVGSSVTYGCDAGYALTGNGGSNIRTCLASGSFDGTAPTCSPVDCGTPPAVANAGAPAVSGGAGGGSTTTYGATAAYTCNGGYTKNGADPMCGAAASWSTSPTCVPSTCGTFTDVIYRVDGTFQITDTPLGMGNQVFNGLGINASTPPFAGVGDATPFSHPPPGGGTDFTNGFVRLRFSNDASGNPQAGTVWLVEWYFPLEFTQTAGSTVTENVDHSVGLLAAGLPNCGGGDAACSNHMPTLARPCATNASGTLTGTALTWGSCTPAPTLVTSWSFVSARSVTGAGCATDYNAWGNATCSSSCAFVPAAGLGDSYQTWNQQLQPFTFSSTNYQSATITMPAAMQIPNGTGQSVTLLSITSSSVLAYQCGSTPGTDLVCNVQ